jgi:hypothetical protein
MQSRYHHMLFLIILSILLIACTGEIANAAPPLKLSPSNNLSNGTQYTSYSATLSASGGTSPYMWSLSGSLPTGLTFSPSGASADISGVPTVANTFNFTVTLNDSAGGTDFVNYSVTISPSSAACTFVGSNTGAVSFAIDPSSVGPIYGTVSQQIQITCTTGKAFTVTANPVGGWTMASGANSVPYTLGFITNGTGAGTTPIDLLTTTSSILQADYQNSPAGLYANGSQVDLTVSWSAPPGSITALLPITTGVTGNVSSTCTSPVNGSMTFSIDPSAVGPIIAATTDAGNTAPTVLCTNQSSLGVSCFSSHGYQLTKNNDGTTDPIAYSITGCPATITGLGFTTAVPINFGLSLNSSDYQNAQAGAHSDTIMVQVTY